MIALYIVIFTIAWAVVENIAACQLDKLRDRVKLLEGKLDKETQANGK